MTQPDFSNPRRVALLWRGDREARRTVVAARSRLAPVFAALSRAGLEPEPAVYGDDFADEVKEQLLGCAAVLVWVDPISGGLDRRTLDPLLREVAAAGVFVSAHPDVILKLGAKQVLYTTREVGWVRDVACYRSVEALAAGVLLRLPAGARRVLKQNRGNGGNGVWSVEPADPPAPLSGADTPVVVQHALVGADPESMSVGDFAQRCARYFKDGGQMIDQPYERRLIEGVIRCYMTHERLVGFSHQLSQGLLRGAERIEGPPPGKVMFGPDEPQFQALRRLMEQRWIAAMQATLGIATADLPVIWDADFIRGDAAQPFVLSEINISAVLPIPDEAPPAIAGAVATRLLERAAAQQESRS